MVRRPGRRRGGWRLRLGPGPGLRRRLSQRQRRPDPNNTAPGCAGIRVRYRVSGIGHRASGIRRRVAARVWRTSPNLAAQCCGTVDICGPWLQTVPRACPVSPCTTWPGSPRRKPPYSTTSQGQGRPGPAAWNSSLTSAAPLPACLPRTWTQLPRIAQREHLLPGARAKGNAVGRARTQTVRWTVCAWRGTGPLARRGLQGQAAACSGLSVRASSESASLSAR